MRALGVGCDGTTIGFALVESGRVVLEEGELAVPASHHDRGDQLNWLQTEAEELLRRSGAEVIWVRKAGSGQFAASADRHETEGVLQVAAHRCGVPCVLKTTEQVRAAAGVPRGKDAYKALLRRGDVAARSNAAKRERYAYAVTALETLDGG
jgi:hypothetical protein